MGVVIYRMLGVRNVSSGGLIASLAHDYVDFGLGAIFYATLLNAVVVVALFVLRIPVRSWLIVALLLLVGTPVALFSGLRIADYVWDVNNGWDEMALWCGPQLIALLVSWGLYAPLSAWLPRYRLLVLRVDDRRRSPCPRCGYELYGSGGRCPECGWELPPAISNIKPPES